MVGDTCLGFLLDVRQAAGRPAARSPVFAWRLLARRRLARRPAARRSAGECAWRIRRGSDPRRRRNVGRGARSNTRGRRDTGAWHCARSDTRRRRDEGAAPADTAPADTGGRSACTSSTLRKGRASASSEEHCRQDHRQFSMRHDCTRLYYSLVPLTGRTTARFAPCYTAPAEVLGPTSLPWLTLAQSSRWRAM